MVSVDHLKLDADRGGEACVGCVPPMGGEHTRAPAFSFVSSGTNSTVERLDRTPGYSTH